jgi:hypothetical protein
MIYSSFVLVGVSAQNVVYASYFIWELRFSRVIHAVKISNTILKKAELLKILKST